MEGKDVFANLKQAYDEAVEYVIENGMPEENEIRRSRLLGAIMSEVSRKDEVKDLHDYRYLQSILSNYDIGRLKYAVKVGRPIIVEGVQGPTGKSTLVRYLRERGANVAEYGLAEIFTLDVFLETMTLKPFKSLF